ncbi:hypothetical protein GCM10007390_35990 [Persicitalea jodogahamensis]|uniref:Uncharacterized protein n=1 Tax=Persicitalea jodogahamensis TaxID=402147 RepID=A0A8J3DD13_9BACT|nr:hypothetical protein GCM10007390_35990 [Persicitalea jodogahamensis]
MLIPPAQEDTPVISAMAEKKATSPSRTKLHLILDVVIKVTDLTKHIRADHDPWAMIELKFTNGRKNQIPMLA